MNEQPILSGPSISAPPTLFVLWVGDATLGQRFAARRAPHIQIVSQTAVAVAEALQGQGERLPDLLVIDATMPGVEPLELLRLAGSDAVDLPVVLLTQPGQDDLIAEAEGLAVCDAVVKTPDFVHQLLPAFAQVRARHDIIAVLRTTRLSEERFRAIIELQPAVTCLVAPDGHILAMNQAGIALLASTREQVVGRPFSSLLPPDEQDSAQEFIAGVCQGQAGGIDHSVIKADGSVSRVRTEAVALPRAEGNVALATLHERFESAAAPDTSVIDGLAAERDRLLAQLREAADSVDVLRADLDGDRAEWADATKAAAAQHAEALQALEVERDRLNQALRDAAEQAAAVHRDAEAERDQLAEALKNATIRCEGLAADFFRAEGQVRDAHARQQRDANTIKAIEGDRDRARAELEQALQAQKAAAQGARDSEALQVMQAQFEAARGEWEIERERAKVSLQGANSRCEALADQLQDALSQLHEGGSHTQALEGRTQDAEARAQALEAQFQYATARVQELEAAAQGAGEEHDRALADLQLKYEALTTEREGVAQKLQSASARCEALSDQSDRAAESLRGLESQVNALRQERDSLAERLRRAEAAARDLEAQQAQAGDATRQLDEERERSAQALQTLRADHKAAELRWSEERALWVERAQQSHDTHMSVVDAIAAERDQLVKKLKSATTRCEALEDAIRDSDSGARESMGRHAQDADTIHHLHADIRAFAAQRDRLSRELDDARAHHTALEQAWTLERARWQESNKTLMAEQQAKVDALQQTIETLHEQREELKQSLSQATARGEALAAEQEQVRHDASVTRLTRELQDANARCEHLVGEMGHARAAVGQAEAQLAAQSADVEAARRRIAALDDIEQRIATDQQDLGALRQELLRFLCDADIRVKAVAERRETALKSIELLRKP